MLLVFHRYGFHQGQTYFPACACCRYTLRVITETYSAEYNNTNTYERQYVFCITLGPVMDTHISSKTGTSIVSTTVNVRSIQGTRKLFLHSGKESRMTLKQCSAGQMVRHISSKRITTTDLISLREQWMMGIRVKLPEPGGESCTRQMRN